MPSVFQTTVMNNTWPKVLSKPEGGPQMYVADEKAYKQARSEGWIDAQIGTIYPKWVNVGKFTGEKMGQEYPENERDLKVRVGSADEEVAVISEAKKVAADRAKAELDAKAKAEADAAQAEAAHAEKVAAQLAQASADIQAATKKK